MSAYTPGRFVVSFIGAPGARDPILLTAQVKAMRDGFERLGHKPALMLLVVADPELDAAVELVIGALDAATSDRAPAVASEKAVPAPSEGET